MAKAAARPMTKSQILDNLATANELPKRKMDEILNSITDLAYSQAKNGFTFPGLGKLVLSARKARVGRNPQTGEAIKIPARTVVRFRIGKQAKDAILGAAPSKGKAKPKAKPAAKKAVAKKPAAKKTAAKRR